MRNESVQTIKFRTLDPSRKNSPISDEGFCLREHLVARLKRDEVPKIRMTLRTEFSGDIQSNFVRIGSLDSPEEFWCDAATGTLYRTDGTSPSGGNMQILV